MKQKFNFVIPVLPSQDIQRDLKRYQEKAGFETIFSDSMYAGIFRNGINIHLQWHADTKEDPLLGGSVIKIFVDDIESIFQEFVERGTVAKDKLRKNTLWNTHEFGFYDLNNNSVFFVQAIK